MYDRNMLEALSMKVSEFSRGEYDCIEDYYDMTISGKDVTLLRNWKDNTAVIMTVEEADRHEAGIDEDLNTEKQKGPLPIWQ